MRVFARNFSTSSVWEAGRKAREAARALAALPNEDRNAALERVAAALESGKVHELIWFSLFSIVQVTSIFITECDRSR
jgi:hypothetical protein